MESPIITLVLPYYDNPKMFQHQQQCWNEWPPHLFSFFEVVVVDDCSPNHPAADWVLADRRFNFGLYRIEKNVRWNWIAAKNVGAHEAKGSWLFLTDMDHRLTSEVFEKLLSFVLQRKTVLKLNAATTVTLNLNNMAYYTFDRVDAPDLTPYKNHPNTYFMSRKLFWKLGGYDEEFSGYYGTDGYYRKRLDRVAEGGFHLEGLATVRYPREVIADASTTEFERKTEYDKSKKKKMKAKLEQNRPMRALTFPWTKLI